MRLILLILFLGFTIGVQARENWIWVKFDDGSAGAMAPVDPGDFHPQQGRPVDESKKPGFSIYFYQKSNCLPVLMLPTDQQTTGIQLRVDERKIHRPQWVRWKDSTPIAQAMFVSSEEPTEEQVKEDLRAMRSFLRDVSEGNTLRVKLEPSGDVSRWSLRGSKSAVDAARKHCFAGVEDRQFFPD